MRPSVLIASPIRYRPECPEVLEAFLEAFQALEWHGERAYWFALHDSPSEQFVGCLRLQERFGDCATCGTYTIPTDSDSRLFGGPRQSGETQENIAFLRNKIFRRFQDSGADLLLMVDSDVVLHPKALVRMAEVMTEVMTEELCTVSLQINNCPFEGGDPAGNAEWCRVPGPSRDNKVPYATDGSVIEVDRSGACTLYPRQALARRFHWDPRYREEHQSLFDELKEIGFRHYLLRYPLLADHRMKREPSLWEAHRKLVERMKGERGE